MVHLFGTTLGHGPGGFIEGTTTDTGQTITGQFVPISIFDNPDSGFKSSLSILNNILNSGLDKLGNRIPNTGAQGIPVSAAEALQNFNLIGLGDASRDITSALNEQITKREEQRAKDQEAARNRQIAQTNINEGFTNALGDISKSLGDFGKGGFDPLKFLDDFPLLGGIGIGGLAVGAVVLLLVIKS